jgi:hypothetical protein
MYVLAISSSTSIWLILYVNSADWLSLLPMANLQVLYIASSIFDSTTIHMLNPQLRELSVMRHGTSDVNRYLDHCTKLVKLRCLHEDPLEILSRSVHLEDLDLSDDDRYPSMKVAPSRLTDTPFRDAMARRSHPTLKRLHVGPIASSMLLDEWRLPLLHELICTPYMVDVVKLINCMVLSPQLRSLSLGDIDAIESTFATLPSVALSQLSNVTKLSFSCYGGDPSTASLTALLLRCPRLVSLEVRHASIDHMHGITGIATGAAATPSIEAKAEGPAISIATSTISGSNTSSSSSSSSSSRGESVGWHDLQSLTFTHVPAYSCLTFDERSEAIAKHNEKARKQKEEYEEGERRRQAAREWAKQRKEIDGDTNDEDGDDEGDDDRYHSDPYSESEGDDEPLVGQDDTTPIREVADMMVDIIISCPSLSRLTIKVLNDEYPPRVTPIALMQRIRTKLSAQLPSRDIALITK